MVAEMVLGVGHVAPGISFKPAVPNFYAEDDCLPRERAGLRVVAEEGVQPADGVERNGLSRPVSGGLELAVGLLGVA
jgi:hypothetical protein